MKLIVGLGNPGKEYKNTRHNVGFDVVDEYLKKHNQNVNKSKFEGMYSELIINGEKVIFLEPQKYMNLSGEVVRTYVDYFKINIEDILVIQDDLDQELGKIKLKQNSSSGGHNGIKNIEMFNKWLVNKDNYNITKEIMENINYDEVKELEPLKGYIMSKDVWIVGGDGWSYDIGFGGIDHIMASGEDVNILVLDTEVYSNTGGQASKSTEKGAVAKFANDGKKTSKKDLARMMMGYPNVYVAQISLGANMNQAIKALRDAGSHKGPSLVIAYSPCINHGIKKGMGNSIEEERLAVKSGYFPIFRYDGEKEEFTLDFKSPDFDLYDNFLDGENRYTMIKTVSPKLAKELLTENKKEAIKRFEYYKNLSN